MLHSDQTLIQTAHSVQLTAYASLVEQSYQQKLTLLMILACQYARIIWQSRRFMHRAPLSAPCVGKFGISLLLIPNLKLGATRYFQVDISSFKTRPWQRICVAAATERKFLVHCCYDINTYTRVAKVHLGGGGDQIYPPSLQWPRVRLFVYLSLKFKRTFPKVPGGQVKLKNPKLVLCVMESQLIIVSKV